MFKPTALITGYSRGGVGDALARQLVERGYHVFATVSNPSEAARSAESQGIELVVLDVTSSDSINDLVNSLKDRLQGKLDMLVNNAAIVAAGRLIVANPATAKRVFDVNVHGLLAMTQAFAPMLVAAKGKLVNLSSAGVTPAPWKGLYFSSKAAVTIMSDTLVLELAPQGVKVITGMLDYIESNIDDNVPGRGTPESSRYIAVGEQIAESAEGNIGQKFENLDDFARKFVDDISGGVTGQWRGAGVQAFGGLVFTPPLSSILY